MDERELRMRRRKKYLKDLFSGPAVHRIPILHASTIQDFAWSLFEADGLDERKECVE
jgi:hypothetical protein